MHPTPTFAGFENARLHWNGHDLLESTGHVPWRHMADHYRAAMAEGVANFRDGLPWRHDARARMDAVPPGARVVWDLVHFDKPRERVGHARRHAVETCALLPPGSEVIAVNEPSVGWRVSGMTRSEGTRTALSMMRAVARAGLPVRWVTSDPFHHLHPEVFRATDRLVETGLVWMVGVNYYPHHAHVPLADVLHAVAERYRLPMMIAETGFHDGHRGNRRHFRHIGGRRQWWEHVHQEIARSGTILNGACWYPWLDMPPWNHPGGRRWPCGWPGRAEAFA